MDYYFWKSIDTKKDIAFLKKQQLVWHSPLKVAFLEDNRDFKIRDATAVRRDRK